MNLRSLLILIALVLLGAFALVNWQAFMTPTRLSLFVGEVQAPLGLVMLVATGLITALFLVYVLFQQAGVIVEARRYARELKANRELADKAEASRFTELRAFVEEELRRLEAQSSAVATGLAARIDDLDRTLGKRLDETTGTLSACVGEIDDKLDRVLQSRSM
jgi:uncharacterized integral membrane protein